MFSTVQTKNTYFPKPILRKEVAPGAASGGPRWGGFGVEHGDFMVQFWDQNEEDTYPPFCLNKAMENQ